MNPGYRILFVAPSLSRKWGGTTRSVLNYYEGLREMGCDVQVASVFRSAEYEDIDKTLLGNKDIHLFKLAVPAWRYSPAFARYMKSEIRRFDIVHIHGIWTAVSYITSRTAMRRGVPYVISPHGMLETDALARKRIKKMAYLHLFEKKAFARASLIHCVTQQEQLNVRRIFSVRKTAIVPNGVQLADYPRKENLPLRQIAFVGRIDPIKGLDRLIKALAGIDGLTLVVAGTGTNAYQEYIGSLIRRLKMQERVKLLGFAGDRAKAEIYRQSLFTVVPSFSEVLSIVSLESMAHGTPVLMTQQCGFQRVGEREAGIILPDNKVETLRKGINEMCHADLRRMSKNAYDLVSEEYSLARVTNALLEEYAGITPK